MTRVYFVRHAQPDHSWKDNRTRPLTEEGREDSKIVTEFLKEIPADCFYCSPYIRSLDTIRKAAESEGKQIVTDERLRERDSLPGSNTPALMERRWADPQFHEDGGESISAVQKRNIEALHEILRNHRDETIVIGTHGTALSTILNYYDSSFSFRNFMRIIDWMPYVLQADFRDEDLVSLRECCYILKDFKGNIR